MRRNAAGLVGVTLIGVSALGACAAPPRPAAEPSPASRAPAVLGRPGTSCSALAPGAYSPRLPEAFPRSEPLDGAGITVITEHAEGAVPTCTDGLWTFTLPATRTAYVKRRNEVMWSTTSGTTADYDRTTLVYRARIVGDLGPTATRPDATDWHHLWQLHGRVDGQWKQPLLALTVQQGRMGLVGGSGAWVQWFGDYADHRSYDVTITAHLDTRPGEGWVQVDVDGAPALPRWSPPDVPTLFPGMDHLQQRSGLYRGSNGAPLRGVTQTVRIGFPT